MEIRAAHGKKLSVLAIAVCLVLALAAIPAYAFWYVHSEEHVAEDGGTGVYEVTLTLDESAVGGGVRTGLIFINQGGTATDAIEEAIESSESQNGLEAIHNYGYESLADYLSSKEYTVTVYHAADQQPGTHTTYDGSGTEGADTQLERYDSVVVAVTKA